MWYILKDKLNMVKTKSSESHTLLLREKCNTRFRIVDKTRMFVLVIGYCDNIESIYKDNNFSSVLRIASFVEIMFKAKWVTTLDVRHVRKANSLTYSD